MADKLPWDIVLDILSRLSVKDLLRYRSVSKPWRSLIDGPDFSKLHLKNSLRTTSHLGVVFGGSDVLYWVDLDGGLNSTVGRLSYPIDLGHEIDVLGGCNGLLALANRDGDMAIWNPSTKRYWALPISFPGFSSLSRYFELFMTGFGYDPISDDHKLLRKISVYNNQEKAQDLVCYSEVAIYSVKAKTWKKVDDFPDHFIYRRGHGVLVGHTLHWESNRKCDFSNLIFAFDLAAEDHRVLAMPDGEDVEASCSRLANLGGCLCVSVLRNYDPVLNKSESVYVWVMKEYGVKESWSKLFSVKPSKVTGGPFLYVVPVAYLKGGDHQILLDLDGERFLLYDMKRKRVEKVKGSSFPRKDYTHVCVGSLIGLDDDDGQITTKQAKKNKNVQGKKKRLIVRDLAVAYSDLIMERENRFSESFSLT